jgi:hypothetical protein
MNRCTLPRALWSHVSYVCIALLMLLNFEAAALAQSAPSLTGRVTTDAGQPAAGVSVHIPELDLRTVTNRDGLFRFGALPASDLTLVIDAIGWRTVRRDLPAATVARRIELTLEPAAVVLEEMVVTTSREAQRRAETPAAVHGLGSAEIESVRPSHPSELLNRVPGVLVSVTGGEGHMTAIRQPITTSPVYLRSTYPLDGVLQSQRPVRGRCAARGTCRDRQGAGVRAVWQRCHRRHDQRSVA